MDERVPRKDAARLLQPFDSFLCPRLHQMDATDPEVAIPYERIARAKPNCLIMERDCLIHVPAEELAPAKRGNCLYPVAVGSNRNFVLLGSLLEARSALCERTDDWEGRGEWKQQR